MCDLIANTTVKIEQLNYHDWFTAIKFITGILDGQKHYISSNVYGHITLK